MVKSDNVFSVDIFIIIVINKIMSEKDIWKEELDIFEAQHKKM